MMSTDLPAGLALDLAIELEVFDRPPCDCMDCGARRRYDREPLHHPPPYSTDLVAAWRVVDAFLAAGYRFMLDSSPSPGSPRPWMATLWPPRPPVESGVTGFGETSAQAICRVALVALLGWEVEP